MVEAVPGLEVVLEPARWLAQDLEPTEHASAGPILHRRRRKVHLGSRTQRVWVHRRRQQNRRSRFVVDSNGVGRRAAVPAHKGVQGRQERRRRRAHPAHEAAACGRSARQSARTRVPRVPVDQRGAAGARNGRPSDSAFDLEGPASLVPQHGTGLG